MPALLGPILWIYEGFSAENRDLAAARVPAATILGRTHGRVLDFSFGG